MFEAKSQQLMEFLRTQRQRTFEESPEYIERFIQTLQTAPTSSSHIDGLTFSDNPRGNTAERALFTLVCREVEYNNPELGIATNTKEYTATAIPIHIEDLLNERRYPHILVHEGYLNVDGNDNISQAQQTGVFGNPSAVDATYAKVLGSYVLPSAPRPNRENPVTLYIDADTLQQFRTIYTDTEQLWSNLPNDILGESFYFFHGIPAQAIIGVSIKNGPIQLIERS